jgi:hypothetical protein
MKNRKLKFGTAILGIVTGTVPGSMDGEFAWFWIAAKSCSLEYWNFCELKKVCCFCPKGSQQRRELLIKQDM